MSIPFPSFEVLRDRYFNDLRLKNWFEATIVRRHNSLGRFVRWLRARSIDSFAEVTVDSVNAYQRSLFHLGNLRTRKPLRFATQSSYLTAVAHWCQWACLNKFLPFNPAVGIELPKEEKRLPSSYLSIVEVERLINRTDVTTHLGIRDRAILEVLYSTAMRRSELLKLTHYDIDRPRRLLAIRQGKGHKNRIVPIGLRAIEWLEKYLRDVRPWLRRESRRSDCLVRKIAFGVWRMRHAEATLRREKSSSFESLLLVILVDQALATVARRRRIEVVLLNRSQNSHD